MRFYHSGRDAAHRLREAALVEASVDLTLVVPARWEESGAQEVLPALPFDVVELPVTRPGDVNRHRYDVPEHRLRGLLRDVAPDVVDIHEEPVSAVAAQLLPLVPERTPVCMYTAQNLDKRFPPPFARWERRALARADGLYPCSAQAAAVARGKGYSGRVEVLPLGYDDRALSPGSQALGKGQERVLALVGRLVPEKGVVDAVEVLARLHARHPTRLVLMGSGPEEATARARAQALGVADRLEVRPWAGTEALAQVYRSAHVVLLPSLSTPRWVEQFGRVIVEAHASGAVVAGYATGSIPEVAAGLGLLVPAGDVPALAASVEALLDDPPAWEKLRAEGIALAATRTWPRVAEGMLRLYEQVRSTGHVPRSLPVATPLTRSRAVAEFGEPATAGGMARPFALPVLRSSPAAARVLGGLADATARAQYRAAHRAEPAATPDRAGPLRVVYLDHCAEPAGGELALLDVLPHLPAHGVIPYVVLGREGPLLERFSDAAATRVLRLPDAAAKVGVSGAGTRGGRAAAGAATLAYAVRLAALLRSVKADVVHANSLKAGVYGSVAARLAGVPLVWHVHDRLSEEYIQPSMLQIVRPLVRRLPAAVIANSNATAATVPPRERVEVVHGPVTTTAAPTPPAPVATTYATLSRLSPWKGQDRFLSAFARAFPGGRERALVLGAALFGEDDYAAALHDLVAELGIADRVAFAGHVDDVGRVLGSVDVVVHTPTIAEPFGRVVGEAMAAGIPVIAPAAGGPLEIIEDGRTGLLVPMNDEDALVEALRKIAGDGALRRRLAASAPAAVAPLAPAPVAGRYAEIYRALLPDS
nr:glycosyltransferase [Motilibacter deserti]